MNRVYHLVWNGALRVVQVASELTSSQTSHAKVASVSPPRRRILWAALVALGLGIAASPTMAQVCDGTDIVACSAQGGVGFGDRPGVGGAGNGQGGGTNWLNGTVLTPQYGAAPSNGVGGAGAEGFRDGSQGGTGGAGGGVGTLAGNIITGGRGNDGGDDSATAGGGGGGGAGLLITQQNLIFPTNYVFVGGAGGNGGAATPFSGAGGGGGGGGGAGLILAASNSLLSLDTNNIVTGGAGGAGGSGDTGFQAFGGGGGGGGDGILVTANTVDVTNQGTITGGAAGAGGIALVPGGAGEAGAGVRSLGQSLTLTNVGTISGGAGAGDNVAGIGVVTRGFSVIQNAGTIQGGLRANGVRESAILFQGANNTLSMSASSVIRGAVEIADASNADIIAAGDTSLDQVTLDGPTAAVAFWPGGSSGRNLSINGISGTGVVTSIAGSGNLALRNVQLNGSIDLSHPGITTLSDTLHTSGFQSYATPVSLGGDTIVIADNGPAIFADPITGGAHSLNVQSFDDVNLGNTGNIFGGPLSLVGRQVTVGSASAVTIGSLQATNNASVTSTGTVTFAGNVSTPGMLTLNTVGSSVQQTGGGIVATILTGNVDGDLVLNGASNAIGDLSSLTANTISIADTTALSLNGIVQALSKITFDDPSGVNVVGTLKADGALAANGGVQIDAGTALTVGNGGTAGTMDADATVNGSLTFNRSDDVTFAGDIQGFGSLAKIGAGKLVYDGDGSLFHGSTSVLGGSLIVGDAAGSAARLGGAVEIGSTAALGGHGTIGGSVNMDSGSTLSPGNSVGTLTIGGDLLMAQGTAFNAEFGANGAGDKVIVGGNLTLQGVMLHATDVGGMGPGVYNLFTYGGTLTESNGGLVLASAPTGHLAIVQTLTGDKKINLIDYSNATLSYWNANGLAGATRMGGGDGTWSNTSNTWTDAQGSVTAPMTPQPGFAIFGGARGTVAVDSSAGAVGTTGMQFLSDGYRVNGDALNLTGSGGPVIVRVGDGSAASSGYVATIDSVLAGTQGLAKADAGTLVLNGVNTFSGGVSVNGGVLSVSSDSNLGDAANAVTLAGGALRIAGTTYTSTDRALSLTPGGGVDIDDATSVFTWNGAISGAGSLQKTGAGTLVLDRANAYSGGTVLSDGTLRVGANDAIGNGGLAMSGGTLSFGADGLALANNVQLSGDADIDVASSNTATLEGNIVDGVQAGSLTKTGTGTLVLLGTSSNTGLTTIADGTLHVGNGTTQGSLPQHIVNRGALVLDRADDVAYAGVMSGNGTFRKLGSNALHLTGDSIAFTGATTIDGGTLLLDGALGGTLALASGAVLAGDGTAGSATLASGSRLSPGGDGSVGKLTFSGDLDLASGTRYAVDVLDTGQGDTVAVGGMARLHGGPVISLGTGAHWNVATTYIILTAAGGVDGTFGEVSSNFAFLTPLLAYTANDVKLTLRRNDVSFVDVAGTRNQRATAGALQTLDQNTTLYRSALTLDGTAARTAFDALSGEIHANLRGAIADDDRYQRDAINQHLLTQYSDGIGEALAAWASAWGHWGNHDGDGNAARLRANGGGLLVGADTGVGADSRIGFALGTGHVSASARSDSASGNTRTAGLYGSGHYDNLLLQAGALYSRRDIDTHRSVEVVDLAERLNGDTRAHSVQAFAEGAYTFRFEHASLAPYLNVARQQLRTDSMHEYGGDAALDVRGDKSAQTFATLGLRGRHELSVEGAVGVFASIGWQHAWGDTETLSRQRFAIGGDAFQVVGTPIAGNAGVATLGLSFRPAPSLTIDASYMGRFAGSAKDQSARLSANWAF